MFAYLVGYQAAAGSYASADQCSLAAACESANERSTCCAATDDLGRVVMPFVMSILRGLGAFVLAFRYLLRTGCGQNG